MSYLSIGNVKISGISACVPKEFEEVISFPLFTLDNAENFTKTTGVERRRNHRLKYVLLICVSKQLVC